MQNRKSRYCSSVYFQQLQENNKMPLLQQTYHGNPWFESPDWFLYWGWTATWNKNKECQKIKYSRNMLSSNFILKHLRYNSQKCVAHVRACNNIGSGVNISRSEFEQCHTIQFRTQRTTNAWYVENSLTIGLEVHVIISI